MNKTWTDEALDLVKTLWMQGISAGHIAKRLQEMGYAFSRNAVVAKVHRLKLPQRATTAHLSRHPRATVAQRKIKPRTEKAKAAKAPPAPKYRSIQRGPNSLPHAEADGYHCKFFCDGESESQGYVCGNPTETPPWCPRCRAIAYQTDVKPLRRVA